MANIMPEAKRTAVRTAVLHAAALLFLKKGYTDTSLREISELSGVHISKVNREFGGKRKILCALVSFVLDRQFTIARQMLSGVTDDPVLYYAAETSLQLYMTESDESMRNLYSIAYSLPESAELIHRLVVEKLTGAAFAAYHPGATYEDFYHMEVATGGIILGFTLLPITPDCPVEAKVQSFLEASLRVYRVPEEMIAEAIAFVKGFDYPTIAKQAIAQTLAALEGTQEESRRIGAGDPRYLDAPYPMVSC